MVVGYADDGPAGRKQFERAMHTEMGRRTLNPRQVLIHAEELARVGGLTFIQFGSFA